MASKGSVTSSFVKQIKENTALTVKAPNMTRFLMSLEDDVDLVIFVFKNGNQGAFL